MKFITWVAIIMVASFSIGFIVYSLTGGVKIETYSVNEIQKLDLEGIQKIKVEVVSANVNLIDSKDAIAELTGTMDSSLKAQTKLKIERKADTLVISLDEPGMRMFVFHEERLQLDIKIPKESLKTIELETVSGNTKVSDFNLENLEIATTSGDIKTKEISSNNLEISTTSGDITIDELVSKKSNIATTSGDITLRKYYSDDVELESISGDILLNPTKINRAEITTVSGDVLLEIKEETNLNYFYETVSGSYSSKITADISKEDDVLIGKIGEGNSSLRVESVSGSFNII